MKKLMLFLSALMLLALSCEKEDNGKLDDNGLTPEINNLVSDEILQEMKDLGMPINTGENPPALGNLLKSTENWFVASPFILLASNRYGDTPGYQFADYYVNFYDQDNDNLTIKLNYENGGEIGEGLGGFIVGEGNDFTVFAEVHSTYMTYEASLVHVISGTLATDGITDLYFANFMLDNNGNLGGVWIENGEGRIIYDNDGFSEKTTYTKAISVGKNSGSSLLK